MASTQILSYRWQSIGDRAEAAVLRALSRWEGTPYVLGSQAPGVRGGVDCVRFGCAVLDELYRTKTPIETLPPDRALHDPAGAMRAMRRIRRLYMPNRIVEDGSIEPGDALVVGPHNGGPGHLMIAGVDGFLWHASGPPGPVVRTGLSTRQRVFRVYRAAPEIKARWGTRGTLR